jgi:hypothetical protein
VARIEDPTVTVEENYRPMYALVGYIVDNEVVLLAFLKALPIYYLLEFCDASQYVRGLVLFNEIDIRIAVFYKTDLFTPPLHTSLPTTVDGLPELQFALLAAVVLEAAVMSAKDLPGDNNRAAVARGFAIRAHIRKYVGQFKRLSRAACPTPPTSQT